LLVSPQLPADEYTYATINVPGSQETWATDINARGDIVGVNFDADGIAHAFLLRKRVFTVIEHPTATGLEARGINARGDIAGILFDATGAAHGFLLSDGRFTLIDRPRASFTFAFGVNNAGDVVGHSDAGDYILKGGKLLNAPGFVRDVQDNGRVFVGVTSVEGGFAGFISRTRGEIELIEYPDLPSPCSVVRGINQRGDMVGVFAYVSADEECSPFFAGAHGFLLRDGEFTRIDVPGAAGTEAWSINDDGVIVGRFVNRHGHTRGFRARPKN
jgi:uncharacterized membrane protein